MALFDNFTPRGNYIITLFLEVIEGFWFTDEQINYLISKIEARRS